MAVLRVGQRVLWAAAAAGAMSCAPGRQARVAVIDLLQMLPAAERRPPAARIGTALATLGGVTRPAIEVPPFSRVTWTLHIPDAATLDTSVGVDGGAGARVSAAVFRIGVADERAYEELAVARLDPIAAARGWTPMSVDLAAYAGFKWSLFYRPRARMWRVVFNTSARDAGPAARLYWARPTILVPSRTR